MATVRTKYVVNDVFKCTVVHVVPNGTAEVRSTPSKYLICAILGNCEKMQIQCQCWKTGCLAIPLAPIPPDSVSLAFFGSTFTRIHCGGRVGLARGSVVPCAVLHHVRGAHVQCCQKQDRQVRGKKV